MTTLRWSLMLKALVVAMSLVAMMAHADSPAPTSQPQPVEKDMHEFMEYVFQPTYKRLKALMASEPADNNAWKGIRADALILAEGGNLLIIRKSKDDAATWDELSTAVRKAGGSMYQAAKKKDYKSARQHYEAMLKNCNACHNKFAEGEHQLSP